MISPERLEQIRPTRLSWVPGDRLDRLALSYREAQGVDIGDVRDKMAHLGESVLKRALGASNGFVRLAVKNNRVAVGICVSLHRPDSNDVRGVWVARAFRESEALEAMLLLAGLEVPEAPTRLWVPDHDSWTQIAVSKLEGWYGSYTRDKSAVCFRRAPLAGT